MKEIVEIVELQKKFKKGEEEWVRILRDCIIRVCENPYIEDKGVVRVKKVKELSEEEVKKLLKKLKKEVRNDDEN